MKRLNISQGLNLLLGAFAVMTIAVIAYFTVMQQQSVARSRSVTEDTLDKLKVAVGLLEQVNTIHNNAQNFLRIKDPDEMEKALAVSRAHQEATSQLVATNSTVTASFNGQYQKLLAAEKLVLDEALKGNTAEAYQLFFTTAAAAQNALHVEMNLIREGVEKTALQDLEAHSAAARARSFKSSVIIGLVLFALLVVGWRIKGRILRELLAVSGTVGSLSQQLTGAAQQFTATSETLAYAASDQAASLEETSASLEEISAMTKRNAENAGNGKKLGTESRQSATAGLERIKELSQTLNAIKSAIGEMQAAVGEMQSSSAEIAKIIKTIDEIAFQTNLLALNAAVEAARAGEAGAGFAVVADEVRALAQRSAQAAKDTSEKIEAAVKRSELGGVASTKVVKSLSEVEATAHSIQQVFTGIAAQITALDEVITEIAAASQEQSRGVSEVNLAVGKMDKVTQANAAGAEENAALSEELNTQAGSLLNIVGQLQTIVSGAPGDPATSPPASLTPAPAKQFNPATKPSAKPGKLTPKTAASHTDKLEFALPMAAALGGKPAGRFQNF